MKRLGSPAVLVGSLIIITFLGWSTGIPESPAVVLEVADGTSPVKFVDVARQSGLNAPNVWGGINRKKYIVETKGSGVGFIDCDGDGWLDVYLPNGIRFDEKYASGNAPIQHLYRNSRGSSFADITVDAGLARTGWGTGVAVGDYDNDGRDDLFCTYWGRNVLWRNDGQGVFTDVTRKAGLGGERVRWGTGSTFLDYDRDGNLDLFVSNYIELEIDKVPLPGEKGTCQWKGVPVMCGPHGLPGGMNLLYHNNGDGSFTDVSGAAGILKPGPRYSITAVSYDFDNDGWPDIYVAVDSEPSLLFRNNHDGTFTDVAPAAGCAYNQDGQEQSGMGVGVGDFDHNGWLDIFKTNFSDDTPNLYRSNGDGTFTDVTFPSGLGVNNQYVCWGAGFMDYDNDTWPDIFHVTGHVYPEIESQQLGRFLTPRLVYRNLGNGRFKDVSSVLGPGVNALHSSRGSAYGDFDNDGDVDVLVLNMNDYPSLLRNEGGNKANWVNIKLVGTKCNRTAIGARVRVVTGKRSQIDEVHSGGSVMSQSDLRLHFGLGPAAQIDILEVKWPTSQEYERFTGVAANQFLTIREGSGIVRAERPPSKP
jgi:enediyne biosynthesis protein E4